MKYTILAIYLLLVGCCSLENEISHCGQKCYTQQCSNSRCPTRSCGLPQCYPLQDCAPKVVNQSKFCNNGAADYDNYRTVNTW